jgi:hypothetical protein
MPVSTIGGAGIDSANFNGTGAILLPSGTTAQRPASPAVGQTRFNTTYGRTEMFGTSTWINVSTGLSSDLGLTSAAPARSALEIIDNGNNRGDGEYWIRNASGVATQVYCDMTNGGWMYLIPPSISINTNTLDYTATQTASENACPTNTLETSGNWRWLYGYRCGTSNISLNFSWTNFVGATQARYAATIGGGNTFSLVVNGSTVSPDFTSGSQRFWSSSAVTTCSGNQCWRDATRANQLGPKTVNLSGNLTIVISAATACQPDCNFGVGYWLGKVAVR